MEIDGRITPLPTARLAQREAFESLLKDYHLSSDAQLVLNKVPLVLLTGPTSSGRNTIIEHLIATGKYYYIVSDTTRPPRYNNGLLEQNGREYWFRSEDEVLTDIRNGQFLEAEVIHGQQVSGVSIRELNKALTEQKIAITDIDIGGINKVTELKPDTIAVVVLPPNFTEWQRRLTGRGKMDADELRRRLITAARIFEAAINNTEFILVVNDTILHAVDQVHDIAEARSVTQESQDKARTLARHLRAETLSYLESL